MINIIINITDKFLCNNLKSIVTKTENKCSLLVDNFDIAKEFDMLNEEPIACRVENASCFQKKVKTNIKMILGIFFVAIPMLSSLSLAYVLNFQYTYAVLFTLLIAVFSSIRMEKIVYRYTQLRRVTLNS